jgi:hypothetical protein
LPDGIKVELKPATVEAFDAYVLSAEVRFDKEVRSDRFLWVDRAPLRRQQVRAGKLLAEPFDGKGDIRISAGLIHHWVGAVFLPGVTLDRTLALLEDYDNDKRTYKPEVVDSKLLSRKGDDYSVYLRLLKKQVLTVVLNSEYRVHYTRVDDTRQYSKSFSTRIAELESPGEPGEREMPVGNDHGFLWRLDSFWRFEERDGGVYLECEAISLTRDVPIGLGWLINPIIRTLPRESLMSTLRETRQALAPGLPVR